MRKGSFDWYRKVLKALQERFLLVSPPQEEVKEAAREALRNLVPRDKLGSVVEELLTKARHRSKKALYGFLKDLGLPPMPVIEEALRNGEDVGIWPDWDSEEVVVSFGHAPFSKEFAPLPWRWKGGEWPDISVNTCCGGIEPRVKVVETERFWIGAEGRERLVFRLDASWEKAFFYGVGVEAIAKALEVLKAFRHLFHALGLEDLREALEELKSAKDGEARWSGEYVLVGQDEIRGLVRGGIFGDLVLDEALLLDHEVRFSSPSGDIAIGLRCHLHGRGPIGGGIEIAGGFVRWKDVRIDFSSNNEVDVLREDLGDTLLREGLNTILAWYAPPPVLEAILEAILDEEHPSRALRDELFFRKLPLVVFGKLS